MEKHFQALYTKKEYDKEFSQDFNKMYFGDFILKYYKKDLEIKRQEWSKITDKDLSKEAIRDF